MKIYNTLSGKKDELKPIKGKKINIFVCGPTVYDYSHIGHARNYIVFDSFVKYLKSRGFEVFYLQNITDLDDKGKPIYKPKDITTAIVDTEKVIANLKGLEKKVQEELAEEIKNKASKTIGYFAQRESIQK